MTENTREVIPATPITPLPVPPVGMPRVPVTLFNVWTWNSPVIPQFYWNVYSAEQRIKEICKQIGKIQAYLDYSAAKINEANVDMMEQINKINADISKQLSDLTNKLTSEVTRLEGLITAEAKAREAADTALQAGLDAEKQARTAADAKLTADLKAETKAREDADEQLHTELSAETTARTHADDQLHQEISTETQARETADTAINAALTKETADRKAADDALSKRIDSADAASTKLTADLAKETKAREAGDAGLQSKIETETSAREAADSALQSKITAETTARGEAISTLTTRVATEESKREAEDGKLGARIDSTNAAVQNNASAIVTETKAREAADTAINAALATKLVRGDLRSSGKITLTPGEGNTVTIGDSFEADFEALQTSIAGLQAALTSETNERRHDDAQLQTAVNARLERGKLLAGDGITVVNDPDQSTVTVSANVTEGKLSAVEAKATKAQETADAAKTAAQGAQGTADAAKSAAAEAKQVADSKLASVSVGAGLTGNGATVNPVKLAAATTSALGGVKVGSGLTVTADGTLSATAQGGTSGLAEVAHDSSLKGSGTSGSPLGVVAAPRGALTAGEQGLTVNAGSGLSISESNQLTTEVTQAKLTAVEGKAEAATQAATQAGSKAEEAKAAATQATSKAQAAEEKATAAQGAATQASSKAQAAETKAEEAKAAAEGKLATVTVNDPITGTGTSTSPLGLNLGSGLTVSSGRLITTAHAKGVAVVRCSLGSQAFSLAKGASHSVSLTFTGQQGKVLVSGFSSRCWATAVVPGLAISANEHVEDVFVNVDCTGSGASADGFYTISSLRLTFFSAREEEAPVRIDKAIFTLYFTDREVDATYQDIPQR